MEILLIFLSHISTDAIFMDISICKKNYETTTK